MTKAKEVGNFVIGNYEYRVYRAIDGKTKFCYFTEYKSAFDMGYTNFADGDVCELTDTEITEKALAHIMEVRKDLIEMGIM